MDNKMVNAEILEIDNDILENAMKVFTETKSKENMVQLMTAMREARLLVPAEFPKDLDEEMQGYIKRGEPFPKDRMPQMVPVVVENERGERFVPAFTSKKHLPADHSHPVILNVNVDEVFRVASEPDLALAGIILNPVSSKMVLHPQFVEAMKEMKREVEADGRQDSQKQVKMTRDEFVAFARRSVEWGLLPKTVHTEKKEFMDKLDAERGAYIFSVYRAPYGDNIDCPYSESDFDVMILNIDEETCVASIELPIEEKSEPCCSSLYIIWNPMKDEIAYYMVVKGNQEKGNVLARINPEGHFEELMDDFASGSELVSILDYLKTESKG